MITTQITIYYLIAEDITLGHNAFMLITKYRNSPGWKGGGGGRLSYERVGDARRLA